MRILHICVAGPYTEGMGYQENFLPKFHKQLGHDVYLLASCYQWDKGVIVHTPEEQRRMRDGVFLYRREFRKFCCEPLAKKIRLVKGMREVMEDVKPDFIMAHGISTFSLYDVRNYVRGNQKTRLIVDSHADYVNSATNWLSKNLLHRRIWRHVAQMIEPYTEVFYGVLPARVDFIKEMYHLPPEKCRLLCMGADDGFVKGSVGVEKTAAIRKKYQIGEEDFLIVTGGKIDSVKTQVLLLMRAVHKIADRNVRLVIFGTVEEHLKKAFEKMVDGSRVQYIGWLQPIETYEVVAAADLAVYPGGHSTLWEQSAGQGIPMAVKYWPGTDHVNVNGNAVFLRNDSADEMKKLLSDLVLDKMRYQKMKTAAVEAMSEFSYQNIAERCLGA